MSNYKTVCGLEVHAELSTKTKVFCSCSTAFGAPPNSQVCEVCTGMPGTLPVLNERVLEFAVRTGLALNCKITLNNRFDRKNYFYPDLPKAYQISQLYLPICTGGFVEIEDSVNGGTKRVRIHEIHIEEDAGKLIHNDETSETLINYNRCGVPLLEIVSEPDIATAEEAVDYVSRLREILRFCGVSDCKMQEGSLRADVNVSVMPADSDVLGTRTEMKNLSSFRAIRASVDAEAKRQISVIESGGRIIQETRRWDEAQGVSVSMRSKEEAQDYRYFPEPDLPPITLSQSYVDEIKAKLPELPKEKKARYMRDFGLSEYDTSIICSSLDFVRLFELTAGLTGSPKDSANWIMGELMRLLNENQLAPEDMGFRRESLAEIINLLNGGKISRDSAKAVFEAVFKDNVNPAEYIARNNLELLSDGTLLRETALGAIGANPKAVSEYLSGKQQALNYLVGQCMRMLKGKASAPEITKLLKELIDE